MGSNCLSSARAQEPSPALDHVLVTRAAVEQWRRERQYPRGRIGVFFGTKTGLHFCAGVNPLDFDFYPMPQMQNGIALFERGLVARRAFVTACPDLEIIF